MGFQPQETVMPSPTRPKPPTTPVPVPAPAPVLPIWTIGLAGVVVILLLFLAVSF